MKNPRPARQQQTLDPVHTGEGELPHDLWAGRLVMFLRTMACLSLLSGLFHWGVVCGIGAPTPGGFADYATPYQSATVFFAIIDLVAAVGLWLAAPWGAVVWLTSAISMLAVELMFPQIYGGRIWVAVFEFILLVSYLGVAILAAREQPA